jgi:hypothetical protein
MPTPPTYPTKLALSAPRPLASSAAACYHEHCPQMDGCHGQRRRQRLPYYRGSTLIATVKGSVTTYTSTGLRANATYSYHLVVFDAAGNLSKASATLSAMTK